MLSKPATEDKVASGDAGVVRATLTIAEVSALTGLNKRSVRRAAAAGTLQAVQVGRRLLIARESVEKTLGGPLAIRPNGSIHFSQLEKAEPLAPSIEPASAGETEVTA